jgi:hypothetical protein
MADDAKRRRLTIFAMVYALITLAAIGLALYAVFVERYGGSDARVWAPAIGAAYFAARAVMTYGESRK